MVRFANPGLSVDQLRNALVDTDGRAPATSRRARRVRRCLVGTQNGWRSPALKRETFSPRADGTFEPYPTTAINRPGDIDTYLLDVTTYSRVISTSSGTGCSAAQRHPRTSIATLPSHDRRRRRCGSHGHHGRARHGPLPADHPRKPADRICADRLRRRRRSGPTLRRNDSFDAAQSCGSPLRVRLRVDVRNERSGSFDLTLHTHGAGQARRMSNFRFACQLGAINVPRVRITSDRRSPRSRADRTEVGRATGKREVKWGLEQGKTVISRERRTHTRYTLWTGPRSTGVPRDEQELEILPPWWDGPAELVRRDAGPPGGHLDETCSARRARARQCAGGVLPEDVASGRRVGATSARASRSAAPAGSTRRPRTRGLRGARHDSDGHADRRAVEAPRECLTTARNRHSVRSSSRCEEDRSTAQRGGQRHPWSI